MNSNGSNTFFEKIKNDKVFLQNLIIKALCLLCAVILLVLLIAISNDNGSSSHRAPIRPNSGNSSGGDIGDGDETQTDGEPDRYEEETVLSDALVMELSSDGQYYSVTGIGDSRHKSVVIPDTYNGLPVKRISAYALYSHPVMTSVKIGANVEIIERYAFADCLKLREVDMGGGVKTIGEGAFSMCESIVRLEIPDSVSDIGAYAFYSCQKLIGITLGNGVKKIGSDAFLKCTKLIDVYNRSSLYLKAGETTHGNVALNAKRVSKTASTLDVIDGFIFCNIEGENYLVGYDGDSNVLTLPDSYDGDKYLIHDYAFYGYTDLLSVTLPEGLEQIGEFSFVGCYKLAEVINLSAIELDDNVNENGSISLYAVAIHSDESLIVTVDDFVFLNYEGGSCLIDYVGARHALRLPEDFMNEDYYVNGYAFYKNRIIEDVFMPDCVSGIGTYVFYDCINLESIRLSENLSSISTYAFRGCTNLVSITLPEILQSIGINAFTSCYKLTEVINNSALNITLGSKDHGSVAEYAKEIHVGESRFVNADGFLFYVSDGINYLISYIGDDSDIILPSNLNGESYRISKFAFFMNHSIRSVTVSDSVTDIESGAFAYCYGLTEIVIGKNVDTIGASAFSECKSLENAYFRGGEVEWLRVTLYSDNTYLSDAVRYYSINQPASVGYWHYGDDEKPVLW